MNKSPRKIIKGVITIEDGANVWPHELFIAKALANAGYSVRFIPTHNSSRSADAYVDNTIFEFKAPEGSTSNAIERNLVKALNYQSPNIVISTVRMKKIRDKSAQSFLVSRLLSGKGIKRLIFVNREGKAVDINALVC